MKNQRTCFLNLKLPLFKVDSIMNYESQKKSVFLIGVILFISLVTVSCKSRNNDIFLKQSFEFAGENKSELEKVLKYFEKDSLKLEAAKFLIRNMPYHNYYDYDLLDTYFSDLYTLANIHDMDIESARDSLSGKYSMLATPNFNVKNDAKTIHSQFLIDNIEHVPFYEIPFAYCKEDEDKNNRRK